ncbi:hypothetical protein [Streptomyces sp. NPDC008121]|uniref:hypothetical protein n=1 Tax=Streptomyces sp. NPDC008121 TaxID=3364809 RepID=UPI0036E2C542
MTATAELLESMLPLEAVKVSDEPRNSTTTMANDAALVVPVEANAMYTVGGYIIYSQNLAASASTGIKLGWAGPAGATMQWTSGGTDSPTSLTGQDVTSQAITATRNLPSNLGTYMSAIPFGTLFTAGAAGTLAVQWAQIASNGTPTIVRAGSRLCLRRTA